MLNSQSVLRNDVTLYCLAQWVWDLFGVECVFLYSLGPKLRHFWAQIVSWATRHARKTFIVLAPGMLHCTLWIWEISDPRWSAAITQSRSIDRHFHSSSPIMFPLFVDCTHSKSVVSRLGYKVMLSFPSSGLAIISSAADSIAWCLLGLERKIRKELSHVWSTG